MPGQPTSSIPKYNIHGSQLLLCIWWDQRMWFIIVALESWVEEGMAGMGRKARQNYFGARILDCLCQTAHFKNSGYVSSNTKVGRTNLPCVFFRYCSFRLSPVSFDGLQFLLLRNVYSLEICLMTNVNIRLPLRTKHFFDRLSVS